MNTIPQTIFSLFWNIYLGQCPRTEISGSKAWTYYQAVLCFIPPPTPTPTTSIHSFHCNLIWDSGFLPTLQKSISTQKLNVTNVYNLMSLDIHILSFFLNFFNFYFFIHILSCYYDHNPGNRPILHLQGFQVKFLYC